MCGSCGFPQAKGHWTEAGAATAHDRLRARHRRAQLLQRILPAFGVNAHDPMSTPGLVVSDMRGHHEIAADLTQLWAAAERLGGRAIDPLDPRFTGEAPEPT
jgi:hypothetical protein